MGQARSCDAAAIDTYVGRRLRQLRQERGLSLLAVAQMMGHTSGQAVSKYEQGSALPAALMFKTAAAWGLPVSAFFEGYGGAVDGEATHATPSGGPHPLDDSTEARKIASLLRTTARSQHPAILRVVKAMVGGSEPASRPGALPRGPEVVAGRCRV